MWSIQWALRQMMMIIAEWSASTQPTRSVPWKVTVYSPGVSGVGALQVQDVRAGLHDSEAVAAVDPRVDVKVTDIVATPAMESVTVPPMVDKPPIAIMLAVIELEGGVPSPWPLNATG